MELFFVNLYFICLLIIFYDINLDLQSNNNMFGTSCLFDSKNISNVSVL